MPKILLAAFATGISLAYFIAPWSTTGLCIVTGILLLLWVPLRDSAAAWAPVLGILCVAGFLHAHMQIPPPDSNNHVSRFADNSNVTLEAAIETVEQKADGGFRVLTDALSIKSDREQYVSGKILLYIKQGEFNARPGQIIRWRARLRTPYRFGSPGEFDYPLYLASKRIYVTSHARHAEDIAVINNHPDQRLSGLENLRLSLGKHIQSVVPEEQSALVGSLLLGLRAGITPEQRQILADSGIAHLFAISGLHFSLLALLLYQAGKVLYTRSQKLIFWQPPQRVIPILLILPLAIYLFLTGNAWATRRAFMIVSIISILIACNRKVNPVNLLALVALIILIGNPLALFQPGFQLSFCGVAGILLWIPRWQKKVQNWPRLVQLVTILFMTTLAATIATAPIILWHFHQVSPAGLITNLAAVPLIAWGAIPVGLTGFIAQPLHPEIADQVLLLTGFLVSATIDIANMVSTLPALRAINYYLTAAEFISLCGLLLIFVPLSHNRHPFLTRAAIIVCAGLIAFSLLPVTGTFQVTAFSVGQGDATLISMANGRHYLVDGGGLPGSSIDPGEALLAPALGRMGVSQLEGIVATHNHPDHISGLTFIVKNLPTKIFYYAGDLSTFPIELKTVLVEKSVKTIQLPPGWTEVYNHGSQALRFFVPEQKARDINNRSIITYAQSFGAGVLLTADAGKEVLEQLMVEPPGPVSLLKLPHHGSRHAATDLYLRWLKPKTSFVSAGRNNVYGFPHNQTLAACEAYESVIYRTDQQGILRFKQTGSPQAADFIYEPYVWNTWKSQKAL